MNGMVGEGNGLSVRVGWNGIGPREIEQAWNNFDTLTIALIEQ